MIFDDCSIKFNYLPKKRDLNELSSVKNNVTGAIWKKNVGALFHSSKTPWRSRVGNGIYGVNMRVLMTSSWRKSYASLSELYVS